MKDPGAGTTRAMWHLAAATWVAIAAVTAMTFHWGFVRSEVLRDRPDNPRRVAEDRRIARGRILDRTGEVLAMTAPTDDGVPVRRYPVPAAAPVVGFQTWRYGAGALAGASYGAGGAEAAYDTALRGDLGRSFLDLVRTRVLSRPQQGRDVMLTLDAQLQVLASDSLAGREGAVVMLDVDSGAVRVMVSEPTFDPVALDRGEIPTDDPARRLLNRATQGRYPPGSAWKAITLAAALNEGLTRLDQVVEDGDRTEHFGGYPVSCDNNPAGITRFDVERAFAYSCNVTFARLGVALGQGGMARYAAAFGIDRAPPLRLPTAEGQLDADGRMSEAELAAAGFGQGEILVTPLHLALVATAFGRRGTMPKPSLLQEVVGHRWDGSADEWGTWRRALPPATAEKVRRAMVASVQDGWARSARVGRASGFTMGGKTGTAETGRGRPHAWFIGFAPAARPRLAIAVLVVEGGSGAEIAAPIAGRLLERGLLREARLTAAGGGPRAARPSGSDRTASTIAPESTPPAGR